MLREIAKRLQFSDDTTIDGNRLDGMLQLLINRFNRLLPRDIERNWTETTIVTGYQPANITGATYPSGIGPWLNVLNESGDPAPQAPDAPSYFPTNKWRARGTEFDSIVPGSAGYQRCWTQSLMITKPVILTGVSLSMRTDTAVSSDFDNDFQYDADPPPGFSNGDSVQDFQLEVAVDNPFTPENRSQSNCEVLRVKFPASAWQMTSAAVVADLMEPQYSNGTGVILGVFVNLPIRVPVPQNSRIRFRLTIPEYEDGSSGWQTDSYNHQFYSATISMLEKP